MRVRLTEDEFEQLVVDVLDSMPESILKVLNNLDVVIEEWPDEEQKAQLDISDGLLFGLYEGIPLTDRDGGYNIVPPDKITIFQGPIETVSSSEEEIAEQVRKTVIHEVAHHFGFDEDRLDELGWA